MIERYIDGREECAHVRASYRAWATAPRADRGTAHAVNRAALDREECAAACYGEAVPGSLA